ncbi:MAG: hypothetical protein ACO1N7_11890 [Sphingobacteriaceae bacterium]
MNRIITSLLLVLSTFSAIGQKAIEVPQNKRDQSFFRDLPNDIKKFGLEDLTKTKDPLSIRVWRANEITEVKQSNVGYSSSLINWINQQPIISKRKEFGADISKLLMDSLLANKILQIPDDTYQGIDGLYITFEVATPESYRLYSYWSPNEARGQNSKDVIRLVSLIDNVLNSKTHRTNFLEELEPGTYAWGMTDLRIDRFLAAHETKSTLYNTIEDRLKKDLKITKESSHRDFPVILINGKPAYLKDVNKYETVDIKNIEIVTNKVAATALYGNKGVNGAVLIETK